MDQTIFNLISLIIYIFFGIIWKADSIANLLIKFTMITMLFYGTFVCLKDLGYIIKF